MNDYYKSLITTQQIYQEVLDGEREGFPEDFWLGEQGQKNAIACIKYLVEWVFHWGISDVYAMMGRHVFELYKLGDMLRICFESKPSKALNATYPDTFCFQEVDELERPQLNLEYEVKRLRDLLGGLDDEDILDLYGTHFLFEFGFGEVMAAYKLTRFAFLELACPNRFHPWQLVGYDWSKPENRRKAALFLLRYRNKYYLPTYKLINYGLRAMLQYHSSLESIYNEIYNIDIPKAYMEIVKSIDREVAEGADHVAMCKKYHMPAGVYANYRKGSAQRNLQHMIKVLAANGLLSLT